MEQYEQPQSYSHNNSHSRSFFNSRVSNSNYAEFRNSLDLVDYSKHRELRDSMEYGTDSKLHSLSKLKRSESIRNES
jgi:hypothetical protein